MAGKKYNVFVTSFTPEQYTFLKALASKAGEPISTTLRAMVEEKRQAALFLSHNVLEYSEYRSTEEPVTA